jgi:hypothetical protein
MSLPYEETLNAEVVQRAAPGQRHELIAARLHYWMKASVADLKATRLCGWREAVVLDPRNTVRPDLALLTTANHRLWLAAEVVSPADHKVDTVSKKEIYEACKVPRLWMIDPRYDNVEVYQSTRYGLALKTILAGDEVLVEPLLPEFQLTIAKLFSEQLGVAGEGVEPIAPHAGQVSDAERVIVEFLSQNPENSCSRMEIARKAVRRSVFTENPHWVDAPLATLVDRKIVVQDKSGAYRLNSRNAW